MNFERSKTESKANINSKLEKALRYLALVGALSGAAREVQAGGGGFESTVAELYGRKAVDALKQKAPKEHYKESDPELPIFVDSIPTEEGEFDKEEFLKILDYLPRDWFDGEVRAITFKDEYYVQSEKNTVEKKTFAVWKGDNREIALYRPIKNNSRVELLRTLIHEGGAHAEDWVSSKNLSFQERLELIVLTETYSRHPDAIGPGASYDNDAPYHRLREYPAFTLEVFFFGEREISPVALQYVRDYFAIANPEYDPDAARTTIRRIVGLEKIHREVAYQFDNKTKTWRPPQKK